MLQAVVTRNGHRPHACPHSDMHTGAIPAAAFLAIWGVTSSKMPAAFARFMPSTAARLAASVPSHAMR